VPIHQNGWTHSNPSIQRNPLPPWRFQALFTLFSKCLSSFPHGTCSLSVSHRYLAFDEIYHQLEQHSQATRLIRKASYGVSCARWTGLSPSTACISIQLTRTDTPETSKYNACKQAFHIGLFPLRSPLLGESLLVSFPPLNNMLKFSGSSCLIWDPKYVAIVRLVQDQWKTAIPSKNSTARSRVSDILQPCFP